MNVFVKLSTPFDPVNLIIHFFTSTGKCKSILKISAIIFPVCNWTISTFLTKKRFYKPVSLISSSLNHKFSLRLGYWLGRQDDYDKNTWTMKIRKWYLFWTKQPRLRRRRSSISSWLQTTKQLTIGSLPP